MLTNVYVDSFNLYYGCLQSTPYRWLDIDALAKRLLPQHQINRMRYFTAKVDARPHDPSQPVRQDTYSSRAADISECQHPPWPLQNP